MNHVNGCSHDHVYVMIQHYVLFFVVTQLAKLVPQVIGRENHDKLSEEWTDFQLMNDEELPQSTDLATLWGLIGRLQLADGATRFPTLASFAKALMCIPHSNASSERAFSVLKKIATDTRSELGHDTLCAIMALKFNEDSCCINPSVIDDQMLKKAKSATYVYTQAHKS